jgi:hypothetical protein
VGAVRIAMCVGPEEEEVGGLLNVDSKPKKPLRNALSETKPAGKEGEGADRGRRGGGCMHVSGRRKERLGTGLAFQTRATSTGER